MPQCGRKTLDLNIILMRATNPLKAMKCGIYHTRVLVTVYSFFMWFLTEISLIKKVDIKSIESSCKEKQVEIKYFFAGDKCLGRGISDSDCLSVFGRLNGY